MERKRRLRCKLGTNRGSIAAAVHLVRRIVESREKQNDALNLEREQNDYLVAACGGGDDLVAVCGDCPSVG